MIQEDYLQPTQAAFIQLAQAEMLDEFWWLLDKTLETDKIDCINAFSEHLPDQNDITKNAFEKLKDTLSLNVARLSIQ